MTPKSDLPEVIANARFLMVCSGEEAMTYYHATTRDRLESIQRLGLCSHGKKNFEWCETGVYLSSAPSHSLGFLLERAMVNSDLWTGRTGKEVVDLFCVIVIDGSRVDSRLLKQDPQIKRDGFWVYPNRIDVTAMPVIGAQEALGFDEQFLKENALARE